jgi:hypothetical protein
MSWSVNKASILTFMPSVSLAVPCRRQPQWINPHSWIWPVLVEVVAAEKSDWILRQVSCRIGVIVTVPVIVQPRLVIKILPLTPDRIPYPGLVRRLADRFLRLPSNLVLRRPSNLAVAIRQFLRRAQMIALLEGDLVLTERLGFLLALTVP